MTLEWNEQAQQEGTVLYTLSCAGNDEDAIKAGVEAALEKAVSLLDRNVRDDSRYLLCEWDADAARLQVVVSDDSKTKDAPEAVECCFEPFDAALDVALLQFLIRDYLTTCTAFLGWSLLAAFHEGDRQRSRLL
ncbi:hypothetical protein [Alcanivorax profundi]|uniref:hypothetical protein n=1 Tax=Alcanivorax profundi TaxID=2338368 RepID=UPI0032B292C8|tara:strand:+ start:2235 stop:2636 length:402 start_codon:yes stop_codon:yes gene_type:complete